MIRALPKIIAGLLMACAGVSLGQAALPELRPLKFNHPGLTVDVHAGLWALPMPMDYDRDGDVDLLVVVNDVPTRGIYLFENPGGSAAKMPVFKAGRKVADAKHNVQCSYVGGEPRVLRVGEEYLGFRANGLARPEKLAAPTAFHQGRVRHNHWRYVDYDGDGDQDISVGLDDWSDYGWDDAFDPSGKWTNGPGHGYVYMLLNDGTGDGPSYAKPFKVEAAGKPIDVFGMPSPCFADFDGDGDLDLICGEFLDGFTYFENTGTRTVPVYAAGRRLSRDDCALRMDLQMISPVPFDWDQDGDIDLIVGQEDGRVAFVEHTGRVESGMPVFLDPVFFQQEADNVAFGVLTTPVAFDWDGDGDQDLLSGNSAGYVGLIENLGGGAEPRWASPKYLKAGEKTIRIVAGENGSIQGPVEAKWGYTTLAVADWNHDGLADLVVNSILGEVVWYRNIGTRTRPVLATAQPIEVRYGAAATRPEWNWKAPRDNQLITQWRTTPAVADLTGDGLNDLVMLDRDGFLSVFERRRVGDALELLPPRHVFVPAEPGSSVYDHDHKAVWWDLDRDGRNDLAMRDASGWVAFYRSLPGLKTYLLERFADRSGDVVHSQDSADQPPLRLNGGWAGRSGRRKIHLADWDGDGRIDVLDNSRNVNWLRNEGTTNDGKILLRDMGELASTTLAGHDTSPATADFDGDGIPDLLVGAENGRFYFMRNTRSR